MEQDKKKHRNQHWWKLNEFFFVVVQNDVEDDHNFVNHTRVKEKMHKIRSQWYWFEWTMITYWLFAFQFNVGSYFLHQDQADSFCDPFDKIHQVTRYQQQFWKRIITIDEWEKKTATETRIRAWFHRFCANHTIHQLSSWKWYRDTNFFSSFSLCLSSFFTSKLRFSSSSIGRFQTVVFILSNLSVALFKHTCNYYFIFLDSFLKL